MSHPVHTILYNSQER